MDWAEYLDALKGRATGMFQRQTSLDEPKETTGWDMVGDVAVSAVPGMGIPTGFRDFERARREGSMLGMGGAVASMLPLGTALKKGGGMLSQKLLGGYEGATDAVRKKLDEAVNWNGGKGVQPGTDKAKELGAWIGRDGQPRYWVNDIAAELDTSKIGTAPRPLSDVLTHPELEKAYPGMAGKVQIRYMTPTESGARKNVEASFKNGIISMSPNTTRDELLTVLHETQHFMQRQNKWLPGGSPEALSNQWTKADVEITSKKQLAEWKQFQKDIAKQMHPDQPGMAKLWLQSANSKDPEKHAEAMQTMYRNLFGEQEARATEEVLKRQATKAGSKMNPSQVYEDLSRGGIRGDEIADLRANQLMESDLDFTKLGM